MVNWNDVLSDRKRVNVVKNWAVGDMSTRQLQNEVTGTDVSGEVRRMLREHGTMYSRRICRKALRRRGLLN